MINKTLKNILLNATVTIAVLLQSACGGSGEKADQSGSNNESNTIPSITQCDSTVAQTVNQMTSPYFEGLGTPEVKTVLPARNGEYSVLWTFTSQHMTIEWDWTVGGSCIQTKSIIQ
jgi:hypothetical protein